MLRDFFIPSLQQLDYEQSVFPSLFDRTSEKKSARKINRRHVKTASKRCAGKEQIQTKPGSLTFHG